MSKKSRSHRQRATPLVELEKLSYDEIAALALAMPPSDPRFGTVSQVFEKKHNEYIKDLRDSAPSDEAREFLDEMVNPETFQRFLDANPEVKAAHNAATAQFVKGDQALTNDLIDEINANHAPVTLSCDDVWESWSQFVEECYGGCHPEWVSDVEVVGIKWFNWLLNNNAYHFSLLRGDHDGSTWLRKVCHIFACRRIFQWKYILLTEHGRDTFADPQIRDQFVEAVRTGQHLIGQ